MQTFEKLNNNKLVLDVFKDAPKADADNETAEDEYQFYLQKVAFYLVHTLTWCKQLHAASELLTNFDYSKKIQASRADHLIYSVENYLIRLNSVYDRVLQVVNAVFHLCINDENINHGVVISNYKVQHRPELVKSVKAIQKYLNDYAQERHTLVHRHSLLDARLRRIELFYLHNPDDLGWDNDRIKHFKNFRANYLREFVVEKKNEFIKINSGLSDLLDSLLNVLHKEYVLQCTQFKLRGF